MITKKLVLPTPIKRSKKKPQKKGLLVLVVAGISAIANWKRFKEQWMEWFGTKEETKSKRRK